MRRSSAGSSGKQVKVVARLGFDMVLVVFSAAREVEWAKADASAAGIFSDASGESVPGVEAIE